MAHTIRFRDAERKGSRPLTARTSSSCGLTRSPLSQHPPPSPSPTPHRMAPAHAAPSKRRRQLDPAQAAAALQEWNSKTWYVPPWSRSQSGRQRGRLWTLTCTRKLLAAMGRWWAEGSRAGVTGAVLSEARALGHREHSAEEAVAGRLGSFGAGLADCPRNACKDRGKVLDGDAC